MRKFLFAFVLLAGCASEGPWPISTQEQRDERLPKVGMSSGEVWGKLGQAMRAPNDFVTSFLPGPGYDGLAYYQIKGLTLRVAEVRFEAGVVKDVRYVPRRPAATATSGVMYADGEASASEEPPSNVISFARTCTWDGGGADALASNAVNWDTDTAPVAGDSIVFPTTTKSCTWDLNLSLVAFTVNSGYVQTITQNSGANFTFSGAFAVNGACTITCNAGATTTTGAFSVAAGTFTQGGAFVSTTFGVTGTGTYTGSSATMSTTAVTHSNTATITATSGIWSVAGSWTKNNSPTFTHNSGTLNITAASTFSPAATLNLVTISTTNAAVTISSGTTAPFGASPSISVGTSTLTIAGVATWTSAMTVTGSMTVTGTLTGTSTPTIAINQSLTTSSATITNAIGTVTFNGTTNSTYTDTGDKLSGTTFAVSKTSTGTFAIAASTNARFGAAPTITMGSGTVTISGTFTWSGLATFTTTGTITTSNGSTLTGTLTPTWTIAANLTITATTTITNTIGTITASGTGATLFTDTGNALSSSVWTINKTNANFTVAASTTANIGASPTTNNGNGGITVTGTLQVSGAWICSGQLTVGATGTVSGALTALQTFRNFTVTAGGVFPASIPIAFTNFCSVDAAGIVFGTCTVSCTTGSFSIANGTTIPLGASPTTNVSTFTYTSNGITQVSGIWTHTGSLTVGAAGTVSGALTSLAINLGLTITSGATWPASVSLTLNGIFNNETIDANGITFATSFISKTSGAAAAGVTIAASTTFPLGANPITNVGEQGKITVSNGGTLSLSGVWSHTGGITISSGATVSGALTAYNPTLDASTTINSGSTWPAGVNVAWTNTTGTSRTFDGGTKVFGAFRRTGSQAATLVVASSNTFTSFRDNDGTVAHTIQFTAGTTQTVTGASTFQYVIDGGLAANTVTLSSTVGGSAYTLAFTGGKPVNLRNCAISDMTTSGAEVWAGPSCTDGTGNTGTIKFAVNPRLRK